MILTGKTIKSVQAIKLGLVDLVVDNTALEKIAIIQAKKLISGEIKLTKKKLDWMPYLLEHTPMGRYFMFSEAKKNILKETAGQYPAPLAILSVIQNNVGKSKAEHLKDEAKTFVELSSSSVSESLISIFQVRLCI